MTMIIIIIIIIINYDYFEDNGIKKPLSISQNFYWRFLIIEEL